jgi:hypothetical protein
LDLPVLEQAKRHKVLSRLEYVLKFLNVLFRSPPARFAFASHITGVNALLHLGRGAKTLSIGLLHDLLGLNAKA